MIKVEKEVLEQAIKEIRKIHPYSLTASKLSKLIELEAEPIYKRNEFIFYKGAKSRKFQVIFSDKTNYILLNIQTNKEESWEKLKAELFFKRRNDES